MEMMILIALAAIPIHLAAGCCFILCVVLGIQALKTKKISTSLRVLLVITAVLLVLVFFIQSL